MKKYKVTMILPVSLQKEDIDPVLDRVVSDIERHDGKVLERRVLGRRTFARPMKKQEAGIYAEMTVDLPPDKVTPLTGRFKLNEKVFRVQITVFDEKAEKKAVAAAKEGEDAGSE